GCHPNVLTYNTLIEGLCLGGNVDEAMKMLTRIIMKGFCIVGRFEESIMHLKKMDVVSVLSNGKDRRKLF
ncbi:hypothetical protein HN51_025678, partial [Arachis hypogaea]